MKDVYLVHHGVQGQQWGVQNGPPYPLDERGQLALKKQKAERKYEKNRAKEIKSRRVSKAAAYGTIGIAGMAMGASLVAGALSGPVGLLAVGAIGAGLVTTNVSAAINIGARIARDNAAIKIDKIGQQLENLDKENSANA